MIRSNFCFNSDSVISFLYILKSRIIKTSCFLRKIFEKFQKLFKISLYLYMYQVSYGWWVIYKQVQFLGRWGRLQTWCILRKCMPNAFDADGVAGVLVHPVAIKATNVFHWNSMKFGTIGLLSMQMTNFVKLAQIYTKSLIFQRVCQWFFHA